MRQVSRLHRRYPVMLISGLNISREAQTYGLELLILLSPLAQGWGCCVLHFLDLEPRLHACQASALPAELHPPMLFSFRTFLPSFFQTCFSPGVLWVPRHRTLGFSKPCSYSVPPGEKGEVKLPPITDLCFQCNIGSWALSRLCPKKTSTFPV